MRALDANPGFLGSSRLNSDRKGSSLGDRISVGGCDALYILSSRPAGSLQHLVGHFKCKKPGAYPSGNRAIVR